MISFLCVCKGFKVCVYITSPTGATGTPPTLTLTNPIPADGTATITYLVKVGNTIPSANPITNTASTAYTYTVDPANPNGATGTAPAASAATQINEAALSVNKKASPNDTKPNGVITYTLTLQNTGNVAANNVVITDMVPAGTAFVSGSVTGATGVPPTLTLPNPIPVGGNAVVSFQVQVGDSLPNPNPVPNTASVTFNYTTDPANPNGASGGSTSNTVTTPVNSAAVTTTKTVDKAFAAPGEVLTYTLRLQNNGNVPANNVVITDAAPAGTTFVSGSVTGATGTLPTLSLSNPIPASGSATVTYQVKIGNSLPDPNPVPNTAGAAFTYTADPANPNGASGSSTSNTVNTQVNSAVLTSAKTVDKAFAAPNDVLTYTLRFRNTGNVPANNVTITDAVPAGATFVSGSVTGANGTPPTLHLNNAIPAGGTAAVTYQIKVGNTIPSANPIVNTADTAFTYTVNPSNPNGASGTAPAASAATEINEAVISIEKTASPVAADLNDIITYTLRLQNTGNVPANNVVITDTLPSGTTFVSGSLTGATGAPPTLQVSSPIPVGGTATVTYQVKIGATAPTPNPVPNMASAVFTYTVNPTAPNGGKGNSVSNTVTTPVNFAAITTAKTVDKAHAAPGDVLTYTLNLRNTGSVSANHVVITDVVPAGAAFVSGSLTGAAGAPPTLNVSNPIPAGETATVTYQVKVGNAVPNPNPMVNTANTAFTYTVDPENPNGASGSSTSNEASTQVNSASVSTAKTVDKAFAALGEVLTYTLSLQNTGNVPANNVTITDAVPTGTAFVPDSVKGATGVPPTLHVSNPIPAGETATVTYQVVVGDTASSLNTISNTATTAFTYTVNPSAPNGSSGNTASNTVNTQVNSAALTTMKSVDKAYASPGDTLTYTVMMKNAGNVAATNVTLDDTMPAGTTFVPGSLTGANGEPPIMTMPKPIPAGEGWTVTYQVKVGDTLPTPNPMPNTAKTAFSHTVDPSNPNGASSAVMSNTVVTAVNMAAITTTKTVDKAYASPGDVLTYTLNLHNTGNVPANNVVISDVLPSGTKFIPGTVTGATGTPPTLNVINPIPADGTATVTFQVQVGDAVPSLNPIANTASITFSYMVDPASPSNSIRGSSTSPMATTQVSFADVTTTKTVDKTFAELEDVLTYTLTLQNSGNVTANNVVITDAIPAGTTFVSGSLKGAVGAPPTLSLVNPIPADGSAVITYQVKVGSAMPNPNPVQNTASTAFAYTVDPSDPNGVSGAAPSNTVSTQVNNGLLTVSKSANKSISYIGDIITYQIAVQNPGNVPADNVVITDQLTTGVSFVTGTLIVSVPYSGTLSSGLALTAPIAPGQTVTLSFQAKVDAIPNPNPVLNKAAAAYTYTLDPTEPDGDSATVFSPAVSTTIFRNNYSRQISDLIESVAREEAALAAIANAEGSKIQAMVAMGGVTTQELLCLNKSVADMIESISMLERVLMQKLNVVNCQVNSTLGCM